MKAISTADAPRALGPYSQGILAGDIVYLAGQIGLNPGTMTLEEGIEPQIRRVFGNLRSVCRTAGGDLSLVVKLTLYLTDFSSWPIVNEVMSEYFQEPYQARTTIVVASLPLNAAIEVDAVMHLTSSRQLRG
ncbi:Rid family detoxifying hydrolase [Paraburkholderia sp.]|uniref:Rid family detoxifying hydrolase n=1 Tax=Paraburkholderia sp. TaxID=1926495 RepID=UPI0039E49031